MKIKINEVINEYINAGKRSNTNSRVLRQQEAILNDFFVYIKKADYIFDVFDIRKESK